MPNAVKRNIPKVSFVLGISGPSLVSLSDWLFEDLRAGLGPHEWVATLVLAGDEGLDVQLTEAYDRGSWVFWRRRS